MLSPTQAMLTVCRSFEGSPSGISKINNNNNNNNNNNDNNNKKTKERRTLKRNVSSCKRLEERDICSNQKTTREETLAGWQDLKEAKVEIDKSGFHLKSHEVQDGVQVENVPNEEIMPLGSSFDLKSPNGSQGENDEGIDVQNQAHALWSSFEVKRREKGRDESRIDGVPDENEEGSDVQDEAMGRWSRTPRDESGFIFVWQLVKFHFHR